MQKTLVKKGTMNKTTKQTVKKTAVKKTKRTLKKAPIKKATKLFRYSGSKFKYKDQIHQIISQMNVSNVDTFIEPFAGSLSSFFSIIHKINAKNIIINDINPKITNIYQQIKQNPAQVKKAFEGLEEHFQALLPASIKSGTVKAEDRHLMEDAQQFYLWVRDYINNVPLSADHAAAMIFVLNHNFNGLYEENKKIGFRITFNWNAGRINIASMLEHIDEMHTFFTTKQVQIFTMDVFELLAKYNNPDTFVYLDPPYIDNTLNYVCNGFDVSLPNQMKLLYATLKYKYVMYSNHCNSHLEGFFDKTVHFYRSNKVSSNTSTESKAKEFMAYRINAIQLAANNIGKPRKMAQKVA